MANPAHITSQPNPIASATTGDLCHILRVTPQTIRRMEQDGRLPPAIRVGRKKLWPAEAVAKLLLGTAHQGGAA